MDYLVPKGSTRHEQLVRRSRFIGVLTPVDGEAEVETRRDALREEFPDATHHCWAYALGDPARSARLRASDDGEPAGTAGRPILNVLQQNRIGDALLVVVRYFGGVKLGAGGLVRAYSSTASQLVEHARLDRATPMSSIRLRLDYADERAVKALLPAHDAEVESVAYGERVELSLRLPAAAESGLREAITETTRGAPCGASRSGEEIGDTNPISAAHPPGKSGSCPSISHGSAAACGESPRSARDIASTHHRRGSSGNRGHEPYYRLGPPRGNAYCVPLFRGARNGGGGPVGGRALMSYSFANSAAPPGVAEPRYDP